MKRRKLGGTQVEVSAIGLGCMGMSAAYGRADMDESHATLQLALEMGVDFWDTADVYGNGANEELISKLLLRYRDRVFIATKFGFRTKNTGGDAFRDETYVDGSPEYVRQAVEKSLKRLKIDTIDLYYAHRVDPNRPVEETVEAMAGLVKEGKVRLLGLSECSPEDLRRAHAIHPIAAVQSEYSLLTRDVEKEILPLTKELGIAFIPFAPLSRGLMTNQLDVNALDENDFRRRLPRYSGEYLVNNQGLAAEFASYAAKKGCTPAQLAIAWVMAQGDHIIPIPGTSKRKHLQDNAGAIDVILTPGDLAAIAQLPLKYPNIGGRYGSREEKFSEKK